MYFSPKITFLIKNGINREALFKQNSYLTIFKFIPEIEVCVTYMEL